MKIPRARADRPGNLKATLPRTFVTEEVRDWVDTTAQREGVSVGDVIREALRRMIAAERRRKKLRASAKKTCAGY